MHSLPEFACTIASAVMHDLGQHQHKQHYPPTLNDAKRFAAARLVQQHADVGLAEDVALVALRDWRASERVARLKPDQPIREAFMGE